MDVHGESPAVFDWGCPLTTPAAAESEPGRELGLIDHE
jgi:hypothetical protein